MTIRLGGLSPNTDMLLVGPFVLLPLPVIPWPTGIVGAFIEKAASRVNGDDLQIMFGFSPQSAPWRFHRPRVASVGFQPSRVRLRVDGADVPAASIECLEIRHEMEYVTEWREYFRRRTIRDCAIVHQDGGDVYEIEAPADFSELDKMAVTLTYKIPYSALKAGTLVVDGAFVDGARVSVPPTTLKLGARFRFWAPIIND